MIEATDVKLLPLYEPPFLLSTNLTGVDNQSIVDFLKGRKDISINEHRREDVPVDNNRPPACREIERVALKTLAETRGFDPAELEIEENDTWGQYREQGQQLGIHNHIGAYAAVVYYAQVPENSGSLWMLPRGWVMHAAQRSDWLVEVKPKTGLLIIFSADVPHYTYPNMSKEARVAYAFNLHGVHK